MVDYPEVIAFGYFFILLLIVGSIFGVGLLTGISIAESNYQDLGQKNQDLFWQVHDLEQELAVCEWNRGVEQNIVLDTRVYGER